MSDRPSKRGSDEANDSLKRIYQEEARKRRLLDQALAPQVLLQQANANLRFIEQAGGTKRIFEEAAQARKLFDQFGKEQFALAQSVRSLIDSPTYRIAQDMTAQWARLNAPYRQAIETVATSLSVVMNDFRDATLAMTEPTKTAILAAQQSLAETDRRMREAILPLRSLMEDVRSQYSGFLEGLQQVDWDQLRSTAQAITEQYQLHVGEGQLDLAGADIALGVAQVIEGVVTEQAADASALAALFGLLATLLQHIIEATNKEVRAMGLIGAFMLIATIKSLEPQYTDADRARDSETREIVERVESSLNQIARADAEEQAYVEALPKAAVVGAGRVRREPSAESGLVTKLPRGTTIGITARSGRWVRIVFRDELTHDLSEGWIYSSSLDPLRNGR